MSEEKILVNLDRCIGCWTCSMACKIGNALDDETYWLTVRTLGSGEGIDKPAGKWPNLTMSWMPVWSKSCIKCAPRTAEGKLPYCVQDCPTKALFYGNAVEAERQKLLDKGFRAFKLPAWEKSKADVEYLTTD